MIIIFIIHLVSWFLAAICDAVMDKLGFHYDRSIFRRKGHETVEHQYYWDPSVSHLNKYKGRDAKKGPRFFGSTTIFVFLTDAWHLSQFLMNLFIIFTVVTALYLEYTINWDYWYAWLIIGGCYKFLYSATFTLFFDKVLER